MNRKDFTKKCLADSLIELLKVKEYKDITINDITLKSGFSRMSYYRNFESIDSILQYYIETFTDEFIMETKIDYDAMDLYDYLVTLYTKLGSHEAKELSTLLYKRKLFFRVTSEFEKRYSTLTDGKNKFFHAYIAGGVFNAYRIWVEDGFQETPEEIAKSITEFTHL